MPQQKPHRSKQDYKTPRVFLDAVRRRLGIEAFAVDLAADAGNTAAVRYLDAAADALRHLQWAGLLAGGWGWLNPPYTDIAPWAHCRATREAGGSVAFLVPSSTGAQWFRESVHGLARVLLLSPRLSFVPDGAPYPKDCVLALFSPHRAPGYEPWDWRGDAADKRVGVHAPPASVVETPAGWLF